jgi:ribulose 1,5-bisphosphate carboxylase large subunit-like protein
MTAHELVAIKNYLYKTIVQPPAEWLRDMKNTIITVVAALLIFAGGYCMGHIHGKQAGDMAVAAIDDQARTWRSMAEGCRELKQAIQNDLDKLGRLR